MVRRRACDLAPLDPADAEHRTRLLSYVWADQAERKARLIAALDHAAGQPERVEAADAAEFLSRELGAPPMDGALRVVVHSIFWQYLADPARLGIQTAMLRAAEREPLAWLRLEADGRTPGRRPSRHAVPFRRAPRPGPRRLSRPLAALAGGNIKKPGHTAPALELPAMTRRVT